MFLFPSFCRICLAGTCTALRNFIYERTELWPNVFCDERRVYAAPESPFKIYRRCRLTCKIDWVAKHAQGIQRLRIGCHKHLPNYRGSLNAALACSNLISLEIHCVATDLLINDIPKLFKEFMLPRSLRHLALEGAADLPVEYWPSLYSGGLTALTSLRTRRVEIMSLPKQLKRLEFGQFTMEYSCTEQLFHNSSSLEYFICNDIFQPSPGELQFFNLDGDSFGGGTRSWQNLKYLELWFPSAEDQMPAYLPRGLETINLIKMHAPYEEEIAPSGFEALRQLECLRRLTISPYRKAPETLPAVSQATEFDEEDSLWSDDMIMQSIPSVLGLSQLEHLALLDFFPSSVRRVVMLSAADRQTIEALPPLGSLRTLEVSTIGLVMVAEHLLERNHLPSLETLVIVHQEVDKDDEDVYSAYFMEAVERVLTFLPTLRTIYTDHEDLRRLKGMNPSAEGWWSEGPGAKRIARCLASKRVRGLEVWEEEAVRLSGRVEWDKVEEGQHKKELYCRDRDADLEDDAP